MAEVYLVRHAKSLANMGDFTAFDNFESPLDPDEGIRQAELVGDMLRLMHEINPRTYEGAVLSSTYRRPQQTAEVAGFSTIEVDSLLDEAVFTSRLEALEAVARHARDGSVPDELAGRADRLFTLIRTGGVAHEIFFTHGLFTAAFKKRCNEEAIAAGQEPPYRFIAGKGYIPRLATITVATV